MQFPGTPQLSDKRALAKKLRWLAETLDKEADNDTVEAYSHVAEVPGELRRVNVATRDDWVRGNKDVWIEDGYSPSVITMDVRVITQYKK